MEKLTAYYFRTMMGNVIRQAIRTKSKDVYVFTGVDIPLPMWFYGHIVAEACLLASYKFNRYLSEYKHHKIESLHLVIDTKNTRHLNPGIMEGRIFSETTILARDLVNEPANVISRRPWRNMPRRQLCNMAFPSTFIPWIRSVG
jgi:leucyl aminopeptidase